MLRGVIISKKKDVNPDSPAEEGDKQQPNNPIYGIANGGNTCFFASALQVIFSLSTFGKMLNDSIVKATGKKEQCKKILTVVQKIHNKTKIELRNKVIQTVDYFPEIIKISKTKTLNWGWVNGWGRQQEDIQMLEKMELLCLLPGSGVEHDESQDCLGSMRVASVEPCFSPRHHILEYLYLLDW